MMENILHKIITLLQISWTIAETCNFKNQIGEWKNISEYSGNYVPIPGLCKHPSVHVQCCIKKDEELIKKIEIKLVKTKIIENLKNNLKYEKN